MKRSRACEDLVALAEDAASASSFRRSPDAWQPFVDGPVNRFKRSRGSAGSRSSDSVSGDEQDELELQERHSLQFMLEMSDLECLSAEVTLSSSAPSASSVLDDDCLPLRRNSREKIWLRKQQQKKQKLAQVTIGMNNVDIRDDDVAVGLEGDRRPRQFPTTSLVLMESPETPEPRILRGLCFPQKSRCIDPLDKRQAQPFDMSAFIMLSISPKR
ncbi:hypothetical protein BBJ28_00012852 [Nothophytophthora sp. Chile5]|nr:hypothetical protein BBJ28_00012852 [Nothophytophthora sp. Chile5]